MNQFVHINGYGLKLAATRKKEARTFRQVMAEMLRQDGYCPHVEKPRRPVLVTGTDPGALLTWVERQHVRQTVNGRHLRSDAWVALVGVSSWPILAEQVRSSMAEANRFKDWQRREVAWLRKTFGNCMRSVVLHTDEQFLHHHWIVVGEHLSETVDLHPGHRIKRLAKAAGADTTTANRHYCSAMAAMQDSYAEDVGGPLGLQRISPTPRPRISTAAVRAKVAAGEWIPGVGPVCSGAQLANLQTE